MREVEKERKSQIKNILRRMYLGGSDRQKRLYIIFYTSDINLGARLGGGAANQNPARDPWGVRDFSQASRTVDLPFHSFGQIFGWFDSWTQ